MYSFAEAETFVFWDMEECKIPNDLDSVYKNIKSALANEGYGGKVSIKAYGKKNKIGSDPLPEGFTFVEERHIGRRDCQIFDDALFCGPRNQPYNLMLIVHEDPLTFLEDTFSEDDVNILIAQNVINPSLVRKLNATSVWLWKSLYVGGNPIDLSAIASAEKTT